MIEKVNPSHPDKVADRIAGDVQPDIVIVPQIAHSIYEKYTSDGKYILDGNRLIICQSNADSYDLMGDYPNAEANPVIIDRDFNVTSGCSEITDCCVVTAPRKKATPC